MGDQEVLAAYGARAAEYTSLLGSVSNMHELDRHHIEKWARGIRGPLLDAGCGPGHWTDLLRKQGVDISGVDLVPEFIAMANRRFPDSTFRVASLQALDLGDSSLSGVLAWYSLIHLAPAGLPKVLNELRRVLKPQGHLLVGFFEGETAQQFDHAVTTAYYWSVERMIGMLNEGRFEILRVETRQDPGSRPHAAIEAIAVPR